MKRYTISQLRHLGLSCCSNRPLTATTWQTIKSLGLNRTRPTRRGFRGGAQRERPIPTITNSSRQIRSYATTNGSNGVNTKNLVTLTRRWDFPSILNLNARSLAIEKADELLVVLRNNQVDIAGVCETWLGDHIPDNAVALPGFECERKDGFRRRAGGVACYIKSTLPYKRLYNLDDNTHEALWITVRPRYLPKQFSCLAVGCLYHPPDADNTSMRDYLIECIDSIFRTHPYSGIILMGDYNQLPDSFLRSHYGLKQVVDQPTRQQSILDSCPI